jgi:NADPH:quinone reductase-like Zn-dependent oxidoreductase
MKVPSMDLRQPIRKMQAGRGFHLGCTFQEDIVFENLIHYIENEDIRAVVAKTYPLKEIVQAQREFLRKAFIGKLVLIPPYGNG